MTRQPKSTELDSIVQLLAEHGFEVMARAFQILLHEAMKLQRSPESRALCRQPWCEAVRLSELRYRRRLLLRSQSRCFPGSWRPRR